jgi:hypothetical protein
MSDTPETDALYERLLAENPGNFIHLEEFLELAWRLERERDEAREELAHLRACVFDVLHCVKTGAFEELEKAWKK